MHLDVHSLWHELHVEDNSASNVCMCLSVHFYPSIHLLPLYPLAETEELALDVQKKQNNPFIGDLQKENHSKGGDNKDLKAPEENYSFEEEKLQRKKFQQKFTLMSQTQKDRKY